MSTRIIMRNDGRATAEGETEVFGTTGAQTVTVLDGATVTFRSGFNNGGDTIRLNGRASDFTVSISGSNVTLRSVVDNITVVIPIGTAANTITFDNGDSRSLSLVNGVPTLGAQTIPNTGPGAAVTAGPGTFTITGAESANEGGVITYTVTRTGTASAETLLFSVDGSTNGGIIASATQGADFSPASGAIVFAAGQATATFTVAVAADSAVEGLEGISVRVVKDGSVVASTNATIIDGNTQGQALTLSPGVDAVAGTAGNDSITGRISEFSSLDTVTGGEGIDTLVLTGALPTDTQGQPVAVLDGAFQGTTGVERLVLTGGTTAQSVDAVLGTLARAAGLQEVVLGGIGGQDQDIDIRAFDAALTVTGSDNAETIAVNLGTAGAKTLNLGGGADQVDVTTTGAAAGSVQVNFTSASVGNGSQNPATIVSANGNVVVNDEGTVIDAANGANVFNVVGLGADGLPDLVNQDRGDFARIELGTGAGDTFATDNGTVENTYFNGGSGNDTFNVLATTTERHFAVGGAGDDTFNIEADDGIIVVIGGEGADSVNVIETNASTGATVASGQEIIDLGDGDDVVSFNPGDTVLTIRGVGADVLNGGTGTDTLSASFSALFAAAGGLVPPTTASTVTNFETITIATSNDLFNQNLVLGRIQAGITTVNTLERFQGGSALTFDVAAATLNLGVVQNLSDITVATSGNGTTDQITIANTVAADGAGDGQDAFGGRAIVATGVETLVINTNADGSAVEQTIGGITITPTTAGGATVVNFVGSNSVDAGLISARTVNASGLTDGAGLTATTTNTSAPVGAVNSLIASAGDDTIALGTAAANVTLGVGDDTLVINAVNGLGAGTSALSGGDGIDTLQMSSADAAVLGLSNAFNANQSGFEVLSITQTDLGATDSIRIDNLGVNRVISAGTSDGAPIPANPEVVTFTAVALRAGETLTITGEGGAFRTVGPAVGDPNGWTAIETANEIRTAFAGSTASNNALDAAFSAGGIDEQVVLTSVQSNNRIDVTIATAPAAASASPTVAPGVNVVATPATFESVTITVPNGVVPAAGSTFTLSDGAGPLSDFVFTAAGGQSDLALATAIRNAVAGANGAGQIASAGSGYTVSAVAGTGTPADPFVFTLTANTAGARTDLTLTGGAAFNGPSQNLALGPISQGAEAVFNAPETQTVTFQTLLQGQTVTVAGRSVTATTRTLSATEVSDAFEAGINGQDTLIVGTGARVAGTLTGFNETDTPGATTLLTATGVGNSDVPNAAVTVTPATAPNAPTLAITQGNDGTGVGPAGTIILENMASGDTLEITGEAGVGSANGSHQVIIIDSGVNTNDVLNLVLTGTTNARDYGTVVVDNVETVNLNLNGLVGAANTAAVIETVDLDIAQATTLSVSGNNGAFITHNSTVLRSFDASGVVGNAGDVRSGLGVSFESLTTTGSVTIRGGVGNDVLRGNSAVDTFNLDRGGSDEVQFSGATRATNGQDVITGFTGGSTSSGDVLVLNGGALGVDSNGGASGIIYNATASNTSGTDLLVSGSNSSVWFVTDGQATINTANVKSQLTGATAQNGEILVADGASGYVLHAASGTSNTFNVYRVFDFDGSVNGSVDARVELVGTVNMTNTFADLTLNNVNQNFVAPASTLTAADVAVAPSGGAMMAMLDNLNSFQIV